MKKFIAIFLLITVAVLCVGCQQSPVEKEVTEGNITKPIEYELDVAWANHTYNREVYLKSLNVDKLSVDSVKHLPIFKIDSQSELENFRQQYKNLLDFSREWNDIASFNQISAKYTGDFFKENTVFIVYVTAISSSFRFTVDSIYANKTDMVIHVKQANNPGAADDMMAGWFMMVSVKRSDIKTCTNFDADLNNQ